MTPPAPIDLEAAHRHSSGHRSVIAGSGLCGCFYCCQTFPPAEIEEWVDDDTTALCPRCGIDAVLPAASGLPLAPEFLRQMQCRRFQ